MDRTNTEIRGIINNITTQNRSGIRVRGLPRLDITLRNFRRLAPFIRNPRRGIAFEIHKFMDLINIQELNNYFMEYFEISISPSTNKLIKFIHDALESMIIEPQRNDFIRIYDKIEKIDLSEFPEEFKLAMKFSVLFASDQPREFQELYINSFITDSIRAYDGDGTDTMSCIKGIFERLILSLKNGCAINPEKYEELIIRLTPLKEVVRDKIFEVLTKLKKDNIEPGNIREEIRKLLTRDESWNREIENYLLTIDDDTISDYLARGKNKKGKKSRKHKRKYKRQTRAR
jgi:hypothetical protein